MPCWTPYDVPDAKVMHSYLPNFRAMWSRMHVASYEEMTRLVLDSRLHASNDLGDHVSMFEEAVASWTCQNRTCRYILFRDALNVYNLATEGQ